jgi:hypothetical protein
MLDMQVILADPRHVCAGGSGSEGCLDVVVVWCAVGAVSDAAGGLVVRFGVALLDAYLEFLAVRSRPNTVVAVAYDLKVFFTVVGKAPGRVVAADALAFVTAQDAGGPARRLQVAGAGGVSARTVRRRLSSVSGLFVFLQARGDVEANPMPRGLPTRRERQRPRQGVPLVRTPRTLPRILPPGQVDALLAALRTHRDRAMAEAMVLGGMRRAVASAVGVSRSCHRLSGIAVASPLQDCCHRHYRRARQLGNPRRAVDDAS